MMFFGLEEVASKMILHLYDTFYLFTIIHIDKFYKIF